MCVCVCVCVQSVSSCLFSDSTQSHVCLLKMFLYVGLSPAAEDLTLRQHSYCCTRKAGTRSTFCTTVSAVALSVTSLRNNDGTSLDISSTFSDDGFQEAAARSSRRLTVDLADTNSCSARCRPAFASVFVLLY
jgi:hypothetical protein